MATEPKCYVSPAIDLSALTPDVTRADIEFAKVDHSGASFEARVFLDNPKADQNTPPTEEHGYAGSFYVFGHGGCFGDVGHCDVHGRRTYDPRWAHPLTPAVRKVLVATAAIHRLMKQGKTRMTLTVVPVITSATEHGDENVLKFESVKIVAYGG